MCSAAGLGAIVRSADVPILDGVAELRAAGAATRCPRQVYAFLGDQVRIAADVSELRGEVLADPQTSGGLLIAVPPQRTADLLAALERHGVATRAVIGELTLGPGYDIV